MTKDEWGRPAPIWDEVETLAQRAQICITFLCAHGLLSDAEKEKAIKRFRKQIEAK